MKTPYRNRVQIGDFNRLTITKEVSFGVYLDAQEYDSILLPSRYVPEGAKIGDTVDVFIYFDSDDKLIATTLTPKAKVGECALLTVSDVNAAGAFLDWGLPKDLLLPYNEQHTPVEKGKHYVVTIYLDEHTDRIVASTRLNRHLNEKGNSFKKHQAVELLIWGKTDLGYKAVINHRHLGLIFRDEAFQPLRYGQKTQGYIKNIRTDKKIDLTLQLPANANESQLDEQILSHLKANGGSSSITDKTHPDIIYREFKVSKRNFKKALGSLYKARKIIIEKDRISLT